MKFGLIGAGTMGQLYAQALSQYPGVRRVLLRMAAFVGAHVIGC